MTRRRLILALVVLLAVAHQDVWWWDDPTPVFGVVPIGLAYHATFSVVAALIWLGVTRWAWPEDPFADEADA